MSTSIEGRRARPMGYDPAMFADIVDPTVAPLVTFDSDGVLFDGVLTDAQVVDVWWRFTTPDDTTETALRGIAELRNTDTTASPLLCAVAAYLLGET